MGWYTLPGDVGLKPDLQPHGFLCRSGLSPNSSLMTGDICMELVLGQLAWRSHVLRFQDIIQGFLGQPAFLSTRSYTLPLVSRASLAIAADFS